MRAYVLLVALTASTGGCSLVTSWAGYVGDGDGGSDAEGPADAGGDDANLQGDSGRPQDADSESREDAGTGDASEADAQGDAATPADAPSVDAPTLDAPAGDGAGGDDASDASTPITFVQLTSVTPSGSVSTASATFPLAQNAGDLVVLVVGYGGAGSITQVDDSTGNGYAPAAAPTHISAGLTQSIFYAKGIASAPAGANTVTVTLGAAVTSLDVRAVEYAGLDPVAPLDTSAGFGGRSASASSGPVTTAAARELVFGAGITVGSFTGAGAAFTLRKLTSSGLGVVEDRVVSSTGSYSADAPLASSASYVMQVAAFR